MKNLLEKVDGEIVGINFEIDLQHLNSNDRKKYLKTFKKTVSQSGSDYNDVNILEDKDDEGIYYARVGRKKNA
ncbi:MAG: hypothetical protein ISS82_06140 [Nanoarchaeota archaeon]|nr:hypothetical protein [Nanoarchaeota archaeon]